MREVLESLGLSPETLAKVALVQTVITESGITPVDLAKVTRLQKALVEGGADLTDVVGTINQVWPLTQFFSVSFL